MARRSSTRRISRPICMLADIGPGVQVLESGVGLGRAQHDDAALGRRDRRLRAARGLRQPGDGPTCAASWARRRSSATTSSCATATRASTSATSTASCSTCPSRGRSCRTRWRRCGPAASSSPTRRRSSRSSQLRDALSSEVVERHRDPRGAAPRLVRRRQAVRPDHRMVAHTGFLTVTRFLGCTNG